MFAAVKQMVQTAWNKRPGFLRGRKALIGGGVIVALIAGWSMFGGEDDEVAFRTGPIDRGSVTRVVSATGTLEPLIKANVGSTVSGPVQEVLVDFNTQVRAGQVLARLDPAPFEQRVVQVQATLAQQRAQLAAAEADYQRYVALESRGFASEQLMSQQRASRDGARAAVANAEAQLATARTDLERSVIRSPIDGVIVDRQVNVGQPVAASLQASTLFIIAQDLSRLQANITVDEADIGEVRENMPVRFSVDAFPDRQFEGRVSQVRQQGASANGVVSYTVVVEADNPGRQLLPGMTANAEIILEERQNVLRVPNSALRFRPDNEELLARAQSMMGGAQAQSGAGGAQAQAAGGSDQLAQQLELTDEQQSQLQRSFQNAVQSAGSNGAAGGDRRAMMRRVRETALRELEPSLNEHQLELLEQLRANGGQRQEQRRQAIVWVLRNNEPTPVQVEIGAADSTHTVLHSGLNEGDEIIIGGPAGANLPGFMGGGRGGGMMGIRGA